ncbi:MAG TPA: recombinase family protein, partial [Acetobacteraceae bacterium]|nr:recombinase family protein [Acetobacteraceae bacterium]
MLEGACYVRWSSEDQTEGSSEERQKEALKRFINDLKINVPDGDAGWIVDGAVSAKDGNNLKVGKISRFIQSVRAGAVKRGFVLCIADPDRLSRAPANITIPLVYELFGHGIRIGVAGHSRIYDGDSDFVDLLRPFFDLDRAHKDNKDRGNRVRIGWTKVRNNHDQPMTCAVPDWCKAWTVKDGDKTTRTVEAIPEHIPTLKRIFELALDIGCGRIAKRLNEEGVPHFRPGAPWRKSYIQKIINGRAVLGEFEAMERVNGKRQGTGIIRKDYPKIIDDGLWNRVQVATRGRIGRVGRPPRGMVNLFTGACKCASCKSGMELRARGVPENGLSPWDEENGRDFLVCSGSKRGTCHHNTNYPLKPIERAFLRKFPLIAKLEHFSEPSSNQRDVENRLYQAKDQVKKHQRRLANLRESLAVAETITERRAIVPLLPVEEEALEAAQKAVRAIENELAIVATSSPKK